jgi:hypothetical protein
LEAAEKYAKSNRLLEQAAGCARHHDATAPSSANLTCSRDVTGGKKRGRRVRCTLRLVLGHCAAAGASDSAERLPAQAAAAAACGAGCGE